MDFNYQGINGYDVSFWQDDNETPQQINFNKMKSSGATFCGVKVGQGTWSDPDFLYNWRESKKAGLVRFGYFFCDDSYHPKTQARKYWELLQYDFDENEMQFADYEVGSWTEWYQLYIFLTEFQMLSGLPDEKAGIYTGYPYWIAHSPTTPFYRDFFGRHPLFLAWYIDDPFYVRVPSTWKEALLWQCGTPRIDVGQESPTIDFDKFNGDQIKFKKYFGSSPDLQPTPIFPDSLFIEEKKYKGV